MQDTIGKLKELKEIGSYEVVSPGITYKSDLPDEQLPNLLDWDKPLAYQPGMLDKVAPILVRRFLIKLES